MRLSTVLPEDAARPWFEPPPQLSAQPERRLAALAARAATGNGAAAVFRPCAVHLTSAPGGGIRVVEVGAAILAMFGLSAGPLMPVPDSLAAALATAFDDLAGAPLQCAAAVRAPRAACVLVRAVLLPLAGGGADAVISWKEVVIGDAETRLRAELLAALTAVRPRALCRDAFV